MKAPRWFMGSVGCLGTLEIFERGYDRWDLLIPGVLIGLNVIAAFMVVREWGRDRKRPDLDLPDYASRFIARQASTDTRTTERQDDISPPAKTV
jgi:hypothetical protein